MNPKRWSGSWTAILIVTALGAIAVGCGGSGGAIASGTGSGGTGSFSFGSISGFGSIVVNGVHYDEASATITDETGAVAKSSDLKLGMIVDVTASEIKTDATDGKRTATAENIRYGSEVEGPITATASNNLQVLGQTVLITSRTLFDDALTDGIASLKVGDIAEIYGFYSGDGQYTATRIELEDDSTARYKVRGTTKNLDPLQKTFAIGNIVINYESLSNLSLANGQFLRVELQKTTNSAGQWIAQKIDGASRIENVKDGVKIELEGYITAFESKTDFAVNGIQVDTRNIGDLPKGLALGVRVEVDGTLEKSVLVATKVERESDQEKTKFFEIEGHIRNLNSEAKTFTIRGVTVDYSGPVVYDDGNEALLRNGVVVEVKGELTTTSNRLFARKIEFEDQKK